MAEPITDKNTRTARMLAGAAAARAKGVKRLDPIEKHVSQPKSLRLAITAKCWDCTGRDSDPNPRQRIRECPCKACPLHTVRPYQQREASNG